MRVSYRYSSSDPDSRKRLPFGAHWVLYGMAVAFLAVALLLVLVARQAATDAALLQAEGVPVTATVGDKVETETRNRDSDGRTRTTRSYRVELQFTTASGETVVVDHPTSQTRFDSLKEGQVVEIFYVPTRPTLVGFDRGEGAEGLWLFWAMGAVFGLLGLGLGLGGWALQRMAAKAAADP